MSLQQMWLGVPALDLPSEAVQPAAAGQQQVTFSSAVEHYKACRRAHAAARLLGTVTFYLVKRFRLYREAGYSTYAQWADDFKKDQDNNELRLADMEWLARAGGIVCFLLRLDGLPDQGRRADYVLQELGSITQLRAVSPKIFNKNCPWEDGMPLQDLFAHEFRLMRETIRVPGRFKELYKSKRSLRVAAEPASGFELLEQAAEQMHFESPAPGLLALQGAAVLVPAVSQAGTEAAAASSVHAAAVSVAVAAAATERQQLSCEGTSKTTLPPLAVGGTGPEAVLLVAGSAAATPAAITAATEGVRSASSSSAAAIAAAAAAAAATVAELEVPIDSAHDTASRSSSASNGSQSAPVVFQTTADAAAAFAAALSSGQEEASATANDPVQLSLDAFGILPHTPAACSQLDGLQPPSPLAAAADTAVEALGSAAGAAAEACDGSSLLLQDNTHLVPDAVQQAAAPWAPLVPAPQMLQARRVMTAQALQQQDQHRPQQQQDEEASDAAQRDQDKDQDRDQDWNPRLRHTRAKSKQQAIKRKLDSAAAGSALLDATDTVPGSGKRQRGSSASGDTGALTLTGPVGHGSSDTPELDVPAAPSSSAAPENQQQVDAHSAGAGSNIAVTHGMTADAGMAELKQKGVVCGTLAEWLQQQLAGSTSQGPGALRLEQRSAAFSRVLVAEEWSDELASLLAAPHYRGRPILVLGLGSIFSPDQPPSAATDSPCPVSVQTASLGASTGTRVDWVMPDTVLSLEQQLQPAAGEAGNRVVATHARTNLALTHDNLSRMRPGEWLDDECINMYLALLQDRGIDMTGGRRSYYFSTHFAPKLKFGSGTYDYEEVCSWTSQERLAPLNLGVKSVLRCDRLIIPIYQTAPYKHWTVLMVDLQERRLVFLDSLASSNPVAPHAMHRVKQWLAQEAQDKLGEVWDTASWAEEVPANVPKQDNGCDCGVFALMFCNRLGLQGATGFDFCQTDMDKLRLGVAFDLLHGKIAATARPDYLADGSNAFRD